MGKCRGARAAAIGIGLLVTVCGASSRADPQTPAPSADELKAARELFQEAYRDEQDKRFGPALEKFKRVAAVKESAPVRYRIASVLASLGRLCEARDAFRALAVAKSSLPAKEQEVADSSAERAQDLDRRIPHLVIRLEETAPPDARVAIDGAPIVASTAARPFPVDPGEHVVQASAKGAQASETRVVLAEGSEVPLTVVLRPAAPPLKVARERPLPAAPSPAGRDKTLGLVALGAGGVLLVTGIVMLAVREGDISDLNKACGQVCPSSDRAELEARHDEAQLLGPLGVGLGVVGLVAAGAGAYVLLRPPPRASAPANGSTTSPPGGSLGIGSRLVRGVAVLGLGGTF